MSQQDLMMDEQKNEATMTLKAAQSFGEYAASGDSKKERELIEILSKRPSLMERLFPTKGQIINQEVIAQRLKQLIYGFHLHCKAFARKKYLY